MIEVIPTVVPASIDDIVAAATKYSGFAKMLHVDIADGTFAPNTTWTPDDNSNFRDMPWEAHLMVAEPWEVGLSCLRAGASRVIGHVEAAGNNAAEMLRAWKGGGAREVGLALLAQTQIEALDPFFRSCDLAMMMTIQKIGVQGLPFDQNAPSRVASMHARFPDLLIEVDGGINERTIETLAQSGARRFCAGSAISAAPDPKVAYEELERRANRA